jgi:iron complex transport system ATP-binding protein
VKEILRLEGVCCGYRQVRVLHDISFTLGRGETLAVLGPNGCGKTTLLRAAAGLLPYTGQIFVDGQDLRALRRKSVAKKIAVLFQNTAVNFEYTVYETVLMGRFARAEGGLFPRFGPEDRAAADAALETVRMTHLRDVGLGQLSGGQLQRVFLARTLAQQPDMILLDEPTNHLDLTYQIELAAFLKAQAAEKGLTVVGVMHDLNLAMYFSDKFLILKEGRVQALGPADTALAPGLLRRVFDMDVAGYMRAALGKWGEI